MVFYAGCLFNEHGRCCLVCPYRRVYFRSSAGEGICREINRQGPAGQKALTYTIMKRLKTLLVNPYIYDFAAYSFWSSPLGLLYVGSILRKNGFEVDLIDCMKVREEKRKEDGRAPFFKEKVTKPAALKDVKKQFRRYGISPQELKNRFSEMDKPDLVLVTSIMTYWYPGTREVIEIAKEAFPQAKIIVGGIYPTLCEDLARETLKKADLIVKSNEMVRFYSFIEETFSISLSYKPSMDDLDAIPYPCYDLYDNRAFVPILTSLGCAFKCTYCATPYMYPEIIRRSPVSVIDEICFWHNRGVEKFVLYDDSFLYKKERYAKPLLKSIGQLPFRLDIYNPNAINAAFIDDELALLLVNAGFREVRIGLESMNPAVQKETGGKVDSGSFGKALKSLRKAGFSRDDLHVYILAGLPTQKWEDIKDTIDYVLQSGARPYIAEYTPIPHTAMFEKYYLDARYPIKEDALYQNNALFPFAWDGFTEERLTFLKRYLGDVMR
ncbi:MAG: B12-binding domain-containing radical SAM protein [Syntrophus sp. (in: bacteria)]|nr:B12-binding domain-containing radical SAM protein [Syntrophus sp. (in: bacteria)]